MVPLRELNYLGVRLQEVRPQEPSQSSKTGLKAPNRLQHPQYCQSPTGLNGRKQNPDDPQHSFHHDQQSTKSTGFQESEKHDLFPGEVSAWKCPRKTECGPSNDTNTELQPSGILKRSVSAMRTRDDLTGGSTGQQGPGRKSSPGEVHSKLGAPEGEFSETENKIKNSEKIKTNRKKTGKKHTLLCDVGTVRLPCAQVTRVPAEKAESEHSTHLMKTTNPDSKQVSEPQGVNAEKIT